MSNIITNKKLFKKDNILKKKMVWAKNLAKTRRYMATVNNISLG